MAEEEEEAVEAEESTIKEASTNREAMAANKIATVTGDGTVVATLAGDADMAAPPPSPQLGGAAPNPILDLRGATLFQHCPWQPAAPTWSPTYRPMAVGPHRIQELRAAPFRAKAVLASLPA